MRMKQSGHSIIVAYEKKRLSTITTYGTKWTLYNCCVWNKVDIVPLQGKEQS